MKKQISIRISQHTNQQINELKEQLGDTQTGVISKAIDRLHRELKKKEIEMLKDKAMNIEYNHSLGVWAEKPFTPNSSARYGQLIFENGGVLDDKVFFANGEECGDFIQQYTEGIDDKDREFITDSEIIAAMIEHYKDVR